MKAWQLVALGVGLGLVAGGSAWAALGSAKWEFYRSDLIRCEDAANLGVNACGTDNVGDDPLRNGRVTVNGKQVSASLKGAEPEELYFVEFVPLANTGADPDGVYEAQDRRFIGAISTNKKGNGTMQAQNDDFGIVGPQIGYFLFTTLDFEDMPGIDSLGADTFAALQDEFEGEEHEFVSGFDPDFVVSDVVEVGR